MSKVPQGDLDFDLQMKATTRHVWSSHPATAPLV